jgi:DNA ligase (NAD+)
MHQLYNKIIELRKELNQHNYNYYVLDNPTISDQDFDFKLKELEELENEYRRDNPDIDESFFSHSPSQKIGGQTNKSFKQVNHKYQMLSLANTYSKDEIVEFVNRATESINKEEELEWICELKYDGVAVSLNYQKGKLIQALTRGNGIIGDDITDNIKTIRSIPLEVFGNNYPDEFEIRGEVIFPHKGFEEFNKLRIEQGEEPLANPRNAASGSIKLLDPKETAKRKLECVLYFLLTEENINNEISSLTHYQRLKLAKSWGFNIPPYMAICKSIEEIMEFISYWDTERFNLGFDIDGIVIKLNDAKLWDKLGSTAKSPRWATAFKFKTERGISKLLSIEYQVGRTGVITPVANFEPILLGGTIVKRASLYNYDMIEKLDIRIGDEVYVEKGGEIIPKIVGVNLQSRDEKSKKLEYISNCPECNTLLIKEEGEAGHYCPNYNHCPPQILGRFQHFISKKAMNIDTLGGERVKYLIDNKLVSDFSDIYSLEESQIIGIGNIDSEKKGSIQEKGASNLIQAIENSKNIPFERVLYGLGIRYVGEVVAKKLAKHYKNINNLINANFFELTEVDEIGEKIAQSIIDYFSNKENITLIEKLKSQGLKFEIEENFESNKLEGLSFVVSGTFEGYSREGIKKTIETNSGKILSGISAKVNYLVAGDKMGPEKKRKAEKLGVKIISEQEFNQLINK